MIVSRKKTDSKNWVSSMLQRKKHGAGITEIINAITRRKYRLIGQEEDAIKIFKNIDKEIDKLLEPFKEQLSDKQLEKIKDLMYGTAFIAEQEGFQLDITYAVKLLVFNLKW